MKKKSISVIVPVFNEEKSIPVLLQELQKIFSSIKKYVFEIIFVDDGSTDTTMEYLQTISQKKKNIRILSLSRNFGKEIATSCGLHHCTSDAAIIMDADLQHPPYLINIMIQKWEEGFEVIYTVRKKTEGSFFFKRMCSRLYYFIMNTISEIPMDSGATDFRLLDKKVIRAFNHLTERSRFFRGMIDWLGFKRTKIFFDAPERKNGEVKYSFRKLYKLAINSITSFSFFPLKFAGYLGMTIIVICTMMLMYMLYVRYYVSPYIFSSLAFVVVSNTILIGIVLTCLGLIAVYIGKIYNEVLNRPLYVIRDKVNFSEKISK